MLKLTEAKYESDMCSVTADVLNNAREELKSGDFFIKTVIKASKNILKELAVLRDSLLKLPKFLI
jgi:hypothetical protein